MVEKFDCLRSKGMKLRVICVMILGILNVGKLILINWLVKKNIVWIGNKFGVIKV